MNNQNNEQQFVATLINALRNPSTVMSNSVIASARKDHPMLFNRALSQYNNQQRQSNRPLSTHQPVVTGGVAETNIPTVAATPTAGAPQSVNNLPEELESLDDEPDFEEFDEEIASVVNEDDEDESIEDDEDSVSEDEDDDSVSEDFEDEVQVLSEEVEGIDGEDFEEVSAPDDTIENISFTHSVALSLYLNSEEGSLYCADDGTWYTTKQPLRRGKGTENDATGAIRSSLEAFIEGVRNEGDGIRFPVAVSANTVANYVSSINANIEQRLSATFDLESLVDVTVTSQSEASENPWGGNALVVNRTIAVRFAIPAIVSIARKGKDDGTKMLASNLKIVNNLVRTLRESTNLVNVQVNILIEDVCASELNGIYNTLISEGNVPTYDRGYARFTVQTEDSIGGEVEG